MSAAWLADCTEYSNLHALELHVCVSCEYPKNEVGNYIPPAKQHCRWDHNLYRMYCDANTKAANAGLSSRHVYPLYIICQRISCIRSSLPKSNPLHTLEFSMLDHLQLWIFHFLKTHKRLDKYNGICLSVPAEPDVTQENQSTEEVFQCNGKEMKDMSQYQLGVVSRSV